jgi:hypothetical protein
MMVFTGVKLSNVIRQLCDQAQHRLWIASPYIGGPVATRCILGRVWWDRLPKDSVRILTDADEGNINIKALDIFQAKGIVRHLRGLHAKLYIIDETVILTSANLTNTAFTCRYEIGTRLTREAAGAAIGDYEQWWDKATEITTKQIDRIVAKRGRNAGEESPSALLHLYDLPPDPGEMTVHQLFADYEQFRTSYADLAQKYSRVGRCWPTAPLYFEVDAFLDYLFHHDGKPSHPYKKKLPRKLTGNERQRELASYFRRFRNWASADHCEERMENASLLQQTLVEGQVGTLTSSNIRQVLDVLNCMQDHRIRNRVLERNTAATIRNAWAGLLYGNAPLAERMSKCADSLFGFKRSGVQELLGWFDPAQYPIRNANTNAGLRFMGYDVRPD